jgi:hypothetical protein
VWPWHTGEGYRTFVEVYGYDLMAWEGYSDLADMREIAIDDVAGSEGRGVTSGGRGGGEADPRDPHWREPARLGRLLTAGGGRPQSGCTYLGDEVAGLLGCPVPGEALPELGDVAAAAHGVQAFAHADRAFRDPASFIEIASVEMRVGEHHRGEEIAARVVAGCGIESLGGVFDRKIWPAGRPHGPRERLRRHQARRRVAMNK